MRPLRPGPAWEPPVPRDYSSQHAAGRRACSVALRCCCCCRPGPSVAFRCARRPFPSPCRTAAGGAAEAWAPARSPAPRRHLRNRE